MSMILLVLYDANKLRDVMAAWSEAGVGGMTILESTGLGRIPEKRMRDDIPLMPDLKDFFLPTPRHPGKTIFTVVENETTVDTVIAATEQVLGDLNKPHTGLLVVLPTTRLVGHNKEKTL